MSNTYLFPRETMAPLVHLSPREKEVLTACAHGMKASMIARLLGISEKSVKNYKHKIVRKFDVVSTTEAVAKAMALGLIIYEIEISLDAELTV